jgi:glucose/arabinose dehydrogenase
MSPRTLLGVALALVGCSSKSPNTDDASPTIDAVAGHQPDSPPGTPDASGPDANLDCPTPGVLPQMKAQLIIDTGLAKPMYVAQPPGSTDLYVVEKGGRIRILRNGALLATDFLTVPDINIPSSTSEGGLLSIAFHPNYASNGRFFIYGTVTGNTAAVREYHRSANPDVATPTPVATLITQPNGGDANVGSTILFGPDGYLWVGTGDGANPPDAADLHSRRGKILRVDVDHPLTPPPGNMTGDVDPFIWDTGMRNPYRMSFDRQTHELYIADAGDTRLEEVDIEPPGSGKRDYAWPRWEGNVCHDGSQTCGAAGALPQYTRPHQVDYSVIIGGSVYRGAAMPCLRGYYVFGILGTSGHILTWRWNGQAIVGEQDLTNTLGFDATWIVGVNEDAAGELYLVLLNPGAIYKLVPG